jgi:hypothetical protein
MARISSYSSTTPTSETNIAFFSAGGHSHDGSNSSLIDTSKYSIFDFDQGLIPTNSERAQAQQRNKINFEDNVKDILRTAGIELSENSINATQIIAGSITTTEIAANTITTNNLVSDILQSSNYSYTSGVFSNAGTFIDLADGSIYSTNFAIDSSGNAYFTGDITGSSGTFSGTVSGGSVAGGTIDIGGSDSTSFHVDTSGNMWSGAATYASAPFRVSSSGALVASSATITGAINATSGTFSGNITSSATISGGTITGATLTTSTLSAGNPTGDGVSITGTQVLINTTGTSSSAQLKFNTNAGTGTNYITGDKALEITTGGSSKTFINIGSTSGALGRIYAAGLYFETYNAEVTRLTASVIGQNRFGSTVRVSDYYGVDISLSDELYAARVTVTGALNVYGTKNFVIQHPLDEDRYLVHAAAEGPTADLVYRGTSSLQNGSVVVELPPYFEAASKADGRTVFVTPKIAADGSQCNMAASSIENGRFTVSTQGCVNNCAHKFDWLVFAIRGDVETVVEPLKTEYNVRKEKETLPEIDPNLVSNQVV